MRKVLLALGVLSFTPAPTSDHPLPEADPPKLAPVVTPTGEKLYRVHFDNLPCREVMDEIERVTGLMFLAIDVPDIRLTVRFDRPVNLNVLFDEINRQLEPYEYFVWLKTQSFSVYPIEKRSHGGGYRDMVSLEELSRRPKRWFYKMILTVSPEGQELAQRVVDQHCEKSFELQPFGSDRIFVRGRISDLQKLVAEMGDHIKK